MSSRRAWTWPTAGLIAAALAWGGCGDDSTTSTTGGPAAGTQSGPSASGNGKVQLYFTSGEQFSQVSRDLPLRGSDVELATRALVRGPTDSEQQGNVETRTQIPDGVDVRDVSIEHGTATVKVSSDFMKGIPAKPRQRSDAQDAELDARLGQVTYTLTQFDRVDAAKVVAGGVPVESATERSDYRPPEHGPKSEPHPAAAAKSLATRDVQAQLAQLGYLPQSAVDGVPGYRTEQAVLAFQAWEGLGRDGVVGPLTAAALAKAKRPEPRAGGPRRRIEVYRAKGVALLIAHGKTRRAIHVSSGGPGNETPAGTFAVFRKELRSWSVPFQVWLPYASYFNQGIAFHEYPDVPPTPASHGCVRVPAPEAPGVYKFAKIDTPVIVI